MKQAKGKKGYSKRKLQEISFYEILKKQLYLTIS